MTKTQWGATPDEWELFSKTLGLTGALLPIVSNPHATISPGSSVTTIGKLPSTYNRDGKLSGLPWAKYTAADSDILKWINQPDYGMGINCAAIRAADIDIEDNIIVEDILEIFTSVLKREVPIRFRDSSNRRLIPYILVGKYPKRKLIFEGNIGAIEFLGDGQQFMACGTHINKEKLEAKEFPVEKYEWYWPSVPHIPEITPEEFEKIYDRIKLTYKVEDTRDKNSRAKKIEKLITEDPIAQQLFDKGVVLDTGPDGTLHITCPFASEHTADTGTTSTSYFLPNTNGFADGRIKCLHSHCSHRHTSDYLEAMGINNMFDDINDNFEIKLDGNTGVIQNKKPSLINFNTLAATDYILKWIIKGVIPETAEVGMIWGPSGCGKSFMVMDMAYAIARGEPWRGFEVPEAGKVIYVASEGRNGLKMRIKAYEAENQIDAINPPGLFLFDGAPNILKPDDIKMLIRVVNEEGGVKLIIIDTMSSSMPGGNENSSEDMSKVFAYCRELARQTGAVVLLVHHSGKDSDRGARGSSLMPQWVDFEMSIQRDATFPDRRSITIDKQRDASDKAEYGFQLKLVAIGMDEDDIPVSSCVVEHTDVLPSRIAKGNLGSTKKKIMECLRSFKNDSPSRNDLVNLVDRKSKARLHDIKKSLDDLLNECILEDLHGLIVEFRGEE